MNAFISYIDNILYIDIENILNDNELNNLKNRINHMILKYKTNSIKVRYHSNDVLSKYDFLKDLITTNM